MTAWHIACKHRLLCGNRCFFCSCTFPGRLLYLSYKKDRRHKVTAWLAAILLVTMLSTGIATVAGQWTVRSFDTLLADNAVCYTVQNALKDEAQAFARYVRQPTSETEQAYTAACAAAEQSLAALPFDYARIGEERYARTWNLLQGYAGYRQERDAFLQLSPSADTYIEQMYKR